MIGNLELLGKRVPDDPWIKRLLDNSMEAAQRGASLTKRLLAFARRQDLKTEPVDVPELVRNMADLLQRSIGPAVQIETHFPLRLVSAFVDANQLELAILNLVVNARDAMPEVGVISIAAKERMIGADPASGLASGRYVCLSVTDAGEGMDEATLARAVEPFFTTKGLGKGTGLGLSMVHGLAEQSGGRLVLQSRPGEGTTAEIWLPAAEVESKTAPEQRTGEATVKGRSAPGLTVLVVDDDSLVLMNTAAMLDDLGHEVIEATSGEQALRALRRSQGADLVITDQLMPGMTGTQLIAAIRSEWPHLPVILATGYADLPEGADPEIPRLSKPFMQNDLAGAIAASVEPVERHDCIVPFRPKSG